MLTVLLLGTPQVLLDGKPLNIPRRKSRALVYYLAAHPRPVPREEVLGLLWPDLDRASAQQTLRTTLHGLRQALGAALLAEDDFLSLSPETEIDVRRFESALRPMPPGREAPPPHIALLADVLDLHRGEFLSAFGLPGTPGFDDWVSTERERYRRLAVRGLTGLARLLEADGDYRSALDVLDRALAFDPLQEDMQRSALRLLYLAGDRAGAIRRYEALRRLLDEEMGVPPMAETRAVYDLIIAEAPDPEHVQPTIAVRVPARMPLAGRPHPGPPVRPTLPFAGREAELRTLNQLVGQGSPRMVMIEGEPGIGKTRLAEEFIASLQTAGSDGEGAPLILAGAARELEGSLPYQPIVEALRGMRHHPEWPALHATLLADLPPVWLKEIGRLLPELVTTVLAPPPAADPADESRLWEGLHQVLLALSRARPIVLFLDDLHWADASTLSLLAYLLRRPHAAPGQSELALFCLATSRPADSRSPLATLQMTLTREGRLTRLTLPRLSPAETAALARHLSPGYAMPLAEWLMRTSEGNPFILAEIVRDAREREMLMPDGTLNLSRLSDSPSVPRTVYSLIQSRLARLSDPARRILDAAVAVGREFEFEVVARAAALSEDAALDALDELRAAGLVRPGAADQPQYAFDHSLTMEVAYREVGEARHRLLHRRVAEAMESLYDRRRLDLAAGLLAFHFSEGRDAAHAVQYAFRAGEQAAALAAWAEAATFYEQALAGADEAQRGTILMALGGARQQAGEFSRASEAFHDAVGQAKARGDEVGADRGRLALGQSFLAQARYAEAIQLAQAVLSTGLPENAVNAEFLWGTALTLEGADLAGAAEHLRRASRLCAEGGDPVTRAEIIFELGSVAAQQGDLERAIGLYRQSLEAVRGTSAMPGIQRLVLAHNNLAYHLHLLGDPSAAEFAEAGMALAREKGLLGLQTYLLSTQGEIALAVRRLDLAEQHFSEGLALAERLSMPERIAGLTANLGLVARARGQTALAIHRLSTAQARADALGVHHLAAQVRLWLAPLLPRDEARIRLAEARAIAEGGRRRRLLEEVARLEAQMASGAGWP